MVPDFHVVHIDFDTPEVLEWHPQEPLDCDVWATAMVGDDRGTNYFQLHICTPLAVKAIVDKRYLFLIDEFRGISDLVAQLDAFIEAKVANRPGDPFLLLSNHWQWEYGTMRRR